MNKTPRIHHLDALRAVMMTLGIVIHSALTYATKDYDAYWGITDMQNTSIAFDALADLIHLFRMQIFFVISGFFAAMLFFERGASKMLYNRIKRVLLPFLAASLIIIPIASWAFIHTQQTMIHFLGEVPTADYTFMSMIYGKSVSMMHLWFLYDLMLLCLIAWITTKILLKYFPKTVLVIRKRFEINLFSGRVLGLGLLFTFSVLLLEKSTITSTSLSFIPSPIILYTYLPFFIFGWLLYHSRHLLDLFGENYKPYFWTALGLCVVRWSISSFQEGNIFYVKMLLAAVIMWYLVYGIIGWFVKKCYQPSALMRYFSDASYWIYLIHLPIAVILPSFLIKYDFGSGFKFLIVVTITTSITILTYDLFVRSTFIGKFLNGRKSARKLF